ncbi:hypothetical protein QUA83_05475, partial [Microcoleus sp. K1-B1]|uniref:hypothetical protein n=1 Tax=Microcoleus sp. K1-B1 TaxID=2818782 RepID=UPI002FD5B5CB
GSFSRLFLTLLLILTILHLFGYLQNWDAPDALPVIHKFRHAGNLPQVVVTRNLYLLVVEFAQHSWHSLCDRASGVS